MFKFLYIAVCFVAAARAFDRLEFLRKHCYEDTDVRTTSFYFPYNTWYAKTLSSGFVCENFVLTKDDLDFMTRNNFVLSSRSYVLFKNCEIAYFNGDLVSRFPNLYELYFENCKVSMQNPEVIGSTKISASFWTLGFHKCYIFENLNSVALQKFESLSSIFIQNSTLQYSHIDEYFLPKKNYLYNILIDNVNVKSFHKGLLENNSHSFNRLTCTSCQLEEVDSLSYKMKQSIYSISFDNNGIKRLPWSLNTFENMNYLQEIHLSGNKITEEVLKRTHFKPLKNLRNLDLSRNTDINSIGYLTFNDTHLQKLNMTNVNLKHLEKLGNANLKTIDFSHNAISTIKQDVFEDLINLKFLNLSDNSIEEFQGAAFQSLRSLQDLRLSFNQIKEIPTNLFSSLTSLHILDLSDNYLEHLDGLENLKQLEGLYLQNNSLKKIASSLNLPKSLKIINMSSNNLNFIGRNTFSNLNQLISLDISYTNNTYLYFDKESLMQLTSLRILKMAGNSISSIENIALPISLKQLDLGNNEISTITLKVLGSLVNLEYLNLAENYINGLDEEIVAKLVSLKHVDFSGNNL